MKRNVKLGLRTIEVFIMVLVMAVCAGCAKSSGESETNAEKAKATTPPAGAGYTETKIPFEFVDGEYIAGVALNEADQPTVYTFKETKKKTEYYNSVLQDDNTWKREKTEWNDSLNQLSNKVGNTIYEMAQGGDGNLYLWMSKPEKDMDGEEFNVSYHVVSVSSNGYVKEVKIKDLGKERKSCKLNYLNGFSISDGGIGIFSGGTWASYDMQTGKKLKSFSGLQANTDNSGNMIFARSFILKNKLYMIADEKCDKLNVYDVESGTMEKEISCNSITDSGCNVFIPNEESNEFYTVNIRGIHRVDASTGKDELLVNNKNQLANENYQIHGAFRDPANEKQFYVWYENCDSSSDEKGYPYFYKYVISE